MPLFDDAWAQLWGQEIRASDGYRRAAATWVSPVVLEIVSPVSPRAVFADLANGDCREARAATAEDLATAPIVIAAAEAVWLDLLAGRLDPMLALFAGKLKLTRGSVSALMPYAGAAKELVVAAARVSRSELA